MPPHPFPLVIFKYSLDGLCRKDRDNSNRKHIDTSLYSQ